MNLRDDAFKNISIYSSVIDYQDKQLEDKSKNNK